MSEELTASERESLRTEIVETQKLQADAARWKLIAVAAVLSVACGLLGGDHQEKPAVAASPSSPPIRAAVKKPPLLERLLPLHQYLLAVPVICLFSDLMMGHLMVRILVIGGYLRSRGDRYEEFCHNLRSQRSAGRSPEIAHGIGRTLSNPFSSEWCAIFLPSVAMYGFVIVVGIVSVAAAPTSLVDWIVLFAATLIAAVAAVHVWIFLKQVDKLATQTKPAAH